jgi:MSHA biogenesis protein MshO
MVRVGAPYQTEPQTAMNTNFRTDSGFTLIELIMVIVLLAILGAMGADFISQAFKGFAASDRRLEIYEEGKLALARLERELHMAVPNSIWVDGEPGAELRFGMIDERVMRTVLGRYQEDDPAGDSVLTDPTTSPEAGTVISIYNRSWSDFSSVTDRRLYRVTAAGPPFTLSKPILAGSPYRRYYPVDRAVRYDLHGTTLRRAAIPVTEADTDLSPFTTAYPLVDGVKPGTLQFSYLPATLTRNAVVSVTFTLARADEEVAFHKEIQVRNVP